MQETKFYAERLCGNNVLCGKVMREQNYMRKGCAGTKLLCGKVMREQHFYAERLCRNKILYGKVMRGQRQCVHRGSLEKEVLFRKVCGENLVYAERLCGNNIFMRKGYAGNKFYAEGYAGFLLRKGYAGKHLYAKDHAGNLFYAERFCRNKILCAGTRFPCGKAMRERRFMRKGYTGTDSLCTNGGRFSKPGPATALSFNDDQIACDSSLPLQCWYAAQLQPVLLS